MRIAGKKIEGLNIEHVFIPRGEDAIHFQAQAVISFDEFEGLCPQPKPRMIKGRDGVARPRPNDSMYEAALEQYATKRIGYMVIKSLSATPDLEFDILNINDPDTYSKWREEFEAAGFADAEINNILRGVLVASGLDDSKIKAARETFLTTRLEAQNAQYFAPDEAQDTESGEPASDSA